MDIGTKIKEIAFGLQLILDNNCHFIQKSQMLLLVSFITNSIGINYNFMICKRI